MAFIYSTNPDFNPDEDDFDPDTELEPGKQNLRIRLDRLKGNKVATIVYQFAGSEETLKELGKSLKSKCGCGGTVKEGEIILQGDNRKKVQDELVRLGYKFKLVGG